MDTSKTITCVEWCFGYGGNHLALKRVVPGLQCIAASEIEAYAVANLVAKVEAGLLDAFPIWSDVKTFPCEVFRDLVDIFVASYPCQPFSSSGKRQGEKDPRHLWPYVRRAVEFIRPRFCFFENVEGHVSLGLREVLTELALLGYRVENSRGEPTWGLFSAAENGAPQNRKRAFILAKREDEQGGVGDYLREQVERFYVGGFFSLAAGTSDSNAECGARSAERGKSGGELGNASSETHTTGSGNNGTRRSPQRFAAGGLGVGLADAKGERLERSVASNPKGWQESVRPITELRPLHWPGFVARPGQTQHGWEPPRVTLSMDLLTVWNRIRKSASPEVREKIERREAAADYLQAVSDLGLRIDGCSKALDNVSNTDELRLLGNGVYPVAAIKAFCELMRRFDK